MKNNKYLWAIAYLFIALLLVLLPDVAGSRLIARDEGFYLLAAKEVMSGSLPYIDFFYPQTPFFPYIYGAYLKVFGFTWESARQLSQLIGVAILLFSFAAMRNFSSVYARVAGAIMIAGSGMTIAWLLNAKSYGLSTLLLVVLYLLLQVCKENLTKRHLFYSGLVVGLLFNVRSYLVVAGFLPLGVIVFSKGSPKEKIQFFSFLALGSFITLIPHLYFIFTDFDSYYFNNIGYHLIRSDRSAEQILAGKLKILSFIVGSADSVKFEGFQFPLLFWSWILLMVVNLVKRSWPSLAWFFVLVIFVVNFIPSPTWLQYFSVAVPFLVFCLLELLNHLPRSLSTAAVTLTAAYFVVTGITEVERYTLSGEGVHGIYETNLESSRMSSISKISAMVNKLSSPGEKIVSVWPGYLFETHAEAFPGMENQFWIRVGHKLSDEEAEKFKIMTHRRLQEVIRNREANLVVIDLHKAGRFFPKKVLTRSGYEEVGNVENVLFFGLSGVEKG